MEPTHKIKSAMSFQNVKWIPVVTQWMNYVEARLSDIEDKLTERRRFLEGFPQPDEELWLSREEISDYSELDGPRIF